MKFAIPALAVALAILALTGVSPARAQVNLPWCGTNSDGAMNCIYETLAKCEAVERADGWCVPNPRG